MPTATPATRLILVEDEFSEVTSLLRRHQELQQPGGPTMPPIEAWPPSEAKARLTRFVWREGDMLLLDCWDRDAVDSPTSSFRSTFFDRVPRSGGSEGVTLGVRCAGYAAVSSLGVGLVVTSLVGSSIWAMEPSER